MKFYVKKFGLFGISITEILTRYLAWINVDLVNFWIKKLTLPSIFLKFLKSQKRRKKTSYLTRHFNPHQITQLTSSKMKYYIWRYFEVRQNQGNKYHLTPIFARCLHCYKRIALIIYELNTRIYNQFTKFIKNSIYVKQLIFSTITFDVKGRQVTSKNVKWRSSFFAKRHFLSSIDVKWPELSVMTFHVVFWRSWRFLII